ncbi:signal transduction histidine kinase [Epilithonimonas hungarica]|uniref:sensor histidine kinase n=1 Tax=Epilithonimonas hungarica TaxID=454006 RepID=UPI00278B9730|nr:HAMP domain-containing sensor histidine kinase [Epilithonimonas hungarica]MDP9956104.1 signal transduction histidine kinase [Epilithonimonas hungarica]
MESKNNHLRPLSFRSRKIVHYFLIICILLIQVIIGSFFYNEFRNKKNLKFIENQLNEIHSIENLTDDSKKELVSSQDYFQKYLITNDRKYLEYYFQSVDKLTKNLDSINSYKNPRLENVVLPQKQDSSEFRKLKLLADSTYQFSSRSSFKIRENNAPTLKKFDLNNYNYEKFNIETKTVSDSVKKKGLLGRIGDAIAGKVDVQKENTIITIKNGGQTTGEKIKSDMDSIMRTINNHYSKEVQRIQVNITNNKNHNEKFFKTFNNLLIYSNDLMNIYGMAIKDSKLELEKEYEKQTSKSNHIRNYLVLGALILMFIVSILIMFLTRIAFIYEKRLKIANDQIKENLNFKNRILGMLSHELRSPLKIIGIFINRINKKTTDESIKEYLKSISFTNNTLLMQANQILEYTKNQQVENKLIPTVFNISDEIDSILTSIEPYIETRNNKFVVNKNIDPSITVYSDNTKINQVFMNILGNANKFTENGQITVDTKTESVDENTISLVTKITDTGAGISESDLEKIFEPYYQGVLSEDVENLGAGLGLSLCKEIVELYSGKISVDSKLNHGTTVSFSVNLKINK